MSVTKPALDVLIIDDDEFFWKPLKQDLARANVTNVDAEESFDNGLSRLSSEKPATVVLDIYAGVPSEGDPAGREIWHDVWKKHFVPIVFTSAGPAEEFRDIAMKHPLLRFVSKNAIGACAEIVKHIQSMIPDGKDIIQVRSELDQEIADSTQRVLTRLVPIVWRDLQIPETRKARLGNAARRLLGSEMEGRNLLSGLPLLPWEQYILPPVGANLLVSDIIRRRADPATDVAAYRVVLTPSCDLAVRKDGNANVTDVLTAKCVPIQRFDAIRQFPDPLKPGFGEKCRERLSPAQQGGLSALPGIDDVPDMAVSYKELDVIKLKDIDAAGNDEKRPYTRVLSVASPFREQLVWAYVEIACRPGVPDRDWDTWGRAIVEKRNVAKSEKSGA